MKLIIAVVLGLFVVGAAVELVFMFNDRRALQNELQVLDARLGALHDENAQLRAQIDYFSKPENLEKELRARLNYRKPDEKLIIIVP